MAREIPVDGDHEVSCDTCRGSGRLSNGKTCPECDGSGNHYLPSERGGTRPQQRLDRLPPKPS